MEGAHWQVIGAAVMNSELFFKVSQGEERVDRIKAFLFLPVAALYLVIMPGRVRTNELVLDTKIKNSFLKKGLDVPIAVGKRLINSKPSSVRTHSARMPLWTYHFTSRFRKSAEE